MPGQPQKVTIFQKTSGMAGVGGQRQPRRSRMDGRLSKVQASVGSHQHDGAGRSVGHIGEVLVDMAWSHPCVRRLRIPESIATAKDSISTVIVDEARFEVTFHLDGGTEDDTVLADVVRFEIKACEATAPKRKV